MIHRTHGLMVPLLITLAGCATPAAPVVDLGPFAPEPLYSPAQVRPGRLADGLAHERREARISISHRSVLDGSRAAGRLGLVEGGGARVRETDDGRHGVA